MGTGSFPRVESSQGMTLTPHPLLVLRYKNQSRAILLLSLRVFMACKKGETISMYISDWRYIRLWFVMNIVLEFSLF
jgi:hypothetical protein